MGGIRVTSELNLLIWETLKKHSIDPVSSANFTFSDNCSIDQPTRMVVIFQTQIFFDDIYH